MYESPDKLVKVQKKAKAGKWERRGTGTRGRHSGQRKMNHDYNPDLNSHPNVDSRPDTDFHRDERRLLIIIEWDRLVVD